MTMPDDGNIFSADLPELTSGAPKIKRFSEIMGDIYANLYNTIDQNPLDETGGDDISKSLIQNYDPAKNGCLEFLTNLKNLAEGHSDDLGNVSDIFNDMNNNNTDQAGGLPGHRH